MVKNTQKQLFKSLPLGMLIFWACPLAMPWFFLAGKQPFGMARGRVLQGFASLRALSFGRAPLPAVGPLQPLTQAIAKNESAT
jgi:hypothetical protein